MSPTAGSHGASGRCGLSHETQRHVSVKMFPLSKNNSFMEDTSLLRTPSSVPFVSRVPL